MNIKLVRPTIELKSEALDYRQEHFDNNELIINGSELFDKINSYEEWLEKVNNNSKIETVDPNWVLTDTFFAIREEDNKIIGIIDLRHTLNEFLKDFGNSGYSVRPSERKKGYATAMIGLALNECKRLGINKVLICCDKDNIGSAKSIINNGGILENEVEENGHIEQRYWIQL